MSSAVTGGLSIIIPAYNEALSIGRVINDLQQEMTVLNLPQYEIIVVDDGSTDETPKVLAQTPQVKVVRHPYNKGYGRSLKDGIEAAQGQWLLFLDGDGQHPVRYVKDFIAFAGEYDLVAGDRSGGKYVRPTIRKPGLWLLKTVANYLVDYKIPDLNCGYRLMNKDILNNYVSFMPNGYSFSTTSTLAFLKDKRSVKFLPVEVEKRQKNSSSAVKPKDMFTTLMLIFRLIMIFSPLRIFFPISLALGFVGIVFLIVDLVNFNVSKSTLLVVITAMLVFFFGLIADQIASLRREIHQIK